MKQYNYLENTMEWLKTIALALIIAIVFKIFIGDTTRVKGNSMNETLHNNDMLFVDKISMKFTGIDRGDIVIIDAPDEEGTKYIKRVIALPYDRVEIKDGQVFVNDRKIVENYKNSDYTESGNTEEKITLDDNQYFVMGDNRLPGESNDSRFFGPITQKHIIGHAVFRFWPLDKIKVVGKDD